MGVETGKAVCAESQAAKFEDCSAVMSAWVGPKVAWVRNLPASAAVGPGVAGVLVDEPEDDDDEPDEELLLPPQPATMQQTATRIARRTCRIISAPAPVLPWHTRSHDGALDKHFVTAHLRMRGMTRFGQTSQRRTKVM